ncbi:hypothetical protein F2Q68_00045322 [Brassica cretica]|uniref:3-deoxy-8-phosphooctulonate synthase n=1 Tax=Brassica cretica TaxID=69181 RepID=A0A8S9LIW8_BRACR|nr:hypothetical protein F2Q68_00045322 [Brassica cretica]
MNSKVMENSAEKIRLAGNPNVMVCERGTMFGYSKLSSPVQTLNVDDLIVDPRNFEWMREANCPVVADITHALQQPAGKKVWFRKRMLYYGVVPRRIKLVTGPTLKIVIAQMLSSVESPFEVSKVVLRAPGDSVMEWFKKPIVQQFLLNEIPSRADILMHKLNVMFPSSAPELRSMFPPKPIMSSKSF